MTQRRGGRSCVIRTLWDSVCKSHLTTPRRGILYLRLSASRRGWASVPLSKHKGFKPNLPSREEWQLSWMAKNKIFCQLTSHSPSNWNCSQSLVGSQFSLKVHMIFIWKMWDLDSVHWLPAQPGEALQQHMKEEVKFTTCWGGVIKGHLLLQEVSSAAGPAWAPLTL